MLRSREREGERAHGQAVAWAGGAARSRGSVQRTHFGRTRSVKEVLLSLRV